MKSLNLKEKLKSIYSLDPRSLALCRISFGLVFLVDLLLRFQFINDFYTDEGLLPRNDFLNIMDHGWNWSVFLVSGTYFWNMILYSVLMLAVLCFTFGIRYRLSTFVMWIMVVSIQNRNWMINNSGEDVIRVFSFIFMFLPMADYYSVDSALNKNRQPVKSEYSSFWTLTFIIQLCYIYVISFYLKSKPEWNLDFTSVHFVINLDQFTYPWVPPIRNFPGLLKTMTFLAMVLEGIIPYFLILRGLKGEKDWFWRLIVILLFVGFHGTLIMLMKIGPFPWVCIALWFGLLPSKFWDKVNSIVTRTTVPTIIHYDGNCGFCLKGVHILKTFLLFENVEIKKTQDDPEVLALMEQYNSWVVKNNGKFYFKYNAFIILLENNTRFFRWTRMFFALPIMHKTGALVYHWVSNNRKIMGKLTQFFVWSDRKRFEKIGWFSLLWGILFLSLITNYNFKRMRSKLYVSSLWGDITSEAMNWYQNWGMFSPGSRKDAGWFVIEGELINGIKYDLWNDVGFIDFSRPKVISNTFPSKEWRKFMMSLTFKPAYQKFMGKYLCRKWNHSQKAKEYSALYKLDIYYMREQINNIENPKKRNPVQKQHLHEAYCSDTGILRRQKEFEALKAEEQKLREKDQLEVDKKR